MKKLGILILIVFAIIAGSTSAYAAFAPSWTLDVNQTAAGYDLILNLGDYTSWDGLVTQQFTGYAGDNPYSPYYWY